MAVFKTGQPAVFLAACRDYPRTYREFVTMFPDSKAMWTYLKHLRRLDGFIYPTCDTRAKAWHQTHNRLVRPVCRHQTTIIAGTIFEKMHTPLTTWFAAAWHLTTAKNGMSAMTLQRTLGTSYRTAWMMLWRSRIRKVSGGCVCGMRPMSPDII